MNNSIEKLCVLYDGQDNQFAKEASQIKIIFHSESKNLEEYIKINQEKNIYMVLNPESYTLDNLKRIKNLKEYTNWTLLFPVSMILDKNKKVDDIKFNALKDCCNSYIFTDLIGNWEVLQFVISLQPKEVYITNILGFFIPDVKKVCDAAGGIGIRVIANSAQSAWEGSLSLTKFFIRPEDVDVYAPYLSGIEFIGDNTIQEVCYETYKRGYWFGDIGEIIIGFNDVMDSRRLPPKYGEYRLKCKKRCVTGSQCHLCKAMKEFTKQMEKTKTMVVPPSRMKHKEE